MLCQNCNINPATVFVKRVVNGHEKEFHLCSSCAKKLDVQISFEGLFQGFLDTFLTYDQKQNISQKNNLLQRKVCPKCGFTYDDFKNTGKLGCGECYKTFHDDLLLVFKNIQGSVRHNGKVPKRAISELSNQSRLLGLQNQLRKAIETEEYEEAARLRDEIRKIKGGFN